MPDYVMPEALNQAPNTASSEALSGLKTGNNILEQGTKLVDGLNNFLDKLMLLSKARAQNQNPETSQNAGDSAIIQSKAEAQKQLNAQKNSFPAGEVILREPKIIFKTNEAVIELKKLIDKLPEATTIKELKEHIVEFEKQGIVIPIIEDFLSKFVMLQK